MQYLRKSTAAGTWENIKEQFDKQGPASIFIDFSLEPQSTFTLKKIKNRQSKLLG